MPEDDQRPADSSEALERLELAGLRAVAEAVRLGLSVEGVVQLCLDHVLDALDLDFGCIYVKRHDYLIRLAVCGRPDELPPLGSLVVLAEAPWLARPFVSYRSSEAAKGWLATPLAVGGELVGVLVAGAHERHHDAFPSLSAAQRVSDPLAVAIDNAERMASVRGLLEDTRDIIFRADERGRWTYLNAAWHELLGEPVSMALGQRAAAFLAPGLRAEQGLALFVPTGSEVGRQTLPFRRRDQQVLWLDVQARLVRDDRGEVRGAAGVLRDVTEQVRQAGELQRHADELEHANRELARADELKSALLRSVSHELNTPLAVMLGYAEMLADGVPDEPTAGQLELLEYIQDGGRRLKRRIDDLMLLARLQAGTLPVTADEIDLWECCSLVLERLRTLAGEAGVQLERPRIRALTVRADRARLEAALTALLDNAIKFSHPGGTVRLLLESDQGGSLAQVRVVDEGDGIAPERLPQLFDMFVQADGTQTRRHDGLGLGLAIARGLLELMGGRLELTSDGVGLGTTAEVLLPLA